MSTENSLLEFARFSRDLRLPKELRAELGRAIGPIVTTQELPDTIGKPTKLVAVGDLCSLSALAQGLLPDAIVVDFKTRRGNESEIREYFRDLKWKTVDVVNPAGMLTRSMWDGIAQAYKSEERVMVVVQGEEDLATLVCIALAPLDSVVLYGIPDRGVVVVRVDEEAKQKVKKVLLQIEEANGNRDSQQKGEPASR
ncbi:MAG: GTP-dependent dephospho-CoA kinase family protein [Thermoplasmata archaeon]